MLTALYRRDPRTWVRAIANLPRPDTPDHARLDQEEGARGDRTDQVPQAQEPDEARDGNSHAGEKKHDRPRRVRLDDGPGERRARDGDVEEAAGVGEPADD